MAFVVDEAEIEVSSTSLRQAKTTNKGAIPYALVGLKVGAGVAKAVLTAAVGQRTPEALGGAAMSASTVRGHVQAELVHLVAMRVSLRSPHQLTWLLSLVAEYCATLSPGSAVTTLATRSLRYQVAAFGVRGIVASAIASAAVGACISTCSLVTSNAAFWRAEESKMSMRQYRYELTTNVLAGVGTVAGSGVGALLGSAVLPGFGTVFGSVTMSLGGSYLVSRWRKGNGPDEKRRRYLLEVAALEPPQIEAFSIEDTVTGEMLEGCLVLADGEMRRVPAQTTGAGDDLTEAEKRVTAEVADEDVPAPEAMCACDSTVTLTRRRRLPTSAQKIDPTVDETGLVPSSLSLRANVDAGSDEEDADASPPAAKTTSVETFWGRAVSSWFASQKGEAGNTTSVTTAAPAARSDSPRSTSSSSSEWEQVQDGTCPFAGSVTALETIHTWEDVDHAVESCGPEEMVLVFAARCDGRPLEPAH